MSNLLKQKLRGKTIKIFGPPGTGKTENLLKRVQRYLKQGYSPDEICYISFTNKAVDECVSRVRKKFKEYDEDDFKYFRTLHSLARQQFAEIPVLDPRADLLMFHTQYGTIKISPLYRLVLRLLYAFHQPSSNLGRQYTWCMYRHECQNFVSKARHNNHLSLF